MQETMGGEKKIEKKRKRGREGEREGRKGEREITKSYIAI